MTVQKVSPVKTDKVSFDGDPSVSVGYTVGSTGYAKPGYVSVSVYLDSRHSDEVKYEVQRATKSGGPFTTIATGSESYTSRLAYLDSTAKTGTTYYYRFRIVSGSDQYVKTSKVIATSKTASVKVGIPEVDQLYASSMNVSEKISKPGVFLWMTSNFANQYDVYRSTNKSKGYRKIKTIYSADFTDTAVKSGTVYYYKVVPKYYDSQTRKITTGKTSGVVGVKFIMNAAGAPSLIQTGNRSLKCTWAADNTADVSYEVWAKRTDITGDAYKRMVVTKKNSCTLTKLDPNGTYKVMIRTVKKSGAAVRYETTDTSETDHGLHQESPGSDCGSCIFITERQEGCPVCKIFSHMVQRLGRIRICYIRPQQQYRQDRDHQEDNIGKKDIIYIYKHKCQGQGAQILSDICETI